MALTDVFFIFSRKHKEQKAINYLLDVLKTDFDIANEDVIASVRHGVSGIEGEYGIEKKRDYLRFEITLKYARSRTEKLDSQWKIQEKLARKLHDVWGSDSRPLVDIEIN